ncbi:RagB/SusD family nutrient uptake outer membrane protein [Capnocytophaga canis]|uniref:RagB/SusD family nutrient uptake outer membrane protein n=1 Tax=Capnocytophaga canis TaxID=1848903 RepID=UPI0015621EB9|nr:RagB/SusD family nutrient uptake outer membrane protein [Capnocytophaga canis]
MKKNFITIGIVTTAFFIQSCSNFLDVSEELAGTVNREDVFNDATLTRKFHRNIFVNIPDSSNMIFSTGYSLSGLDNPWAGATDELKMAQGTLRGLTQNGFNESNAPFHRWGTLYQSIRQANLFLKYAKVIPQTGLAEYIDEAELADLKAQARFLRAYYHYLLFEMYGPISILTEPADPSADNWDYPRNSVDEIITFLDKELFEVSNQLKDVQTEENYRALPTKGAALAVRARMWMYAASPLFNGGYTEALALTNPDGKKLFPVADNAKWQKAVNALEDFISFANGKYELYKEYDGTTYNPHKSLYNMFMKYNNEIIWASSKQNWGNIGGEGIDRRCAPRTERNGFACIAVTQELVDDFFMIDGKSINESPLYSESGFSVAGEDQSGQTEAGTFRMWINREPRFYQTVFFHGRKWHISNNRIKFTSGDGNDKSKSDYPWTGYLLYKRIARNTRNEGSHPRSQYRPSIIFRLAEFYLLYAEALNEVNPADPKIAQYVNRVRERAGIPSWEVSNPSIIGNKEAQREAIRAEMRVELATEGQRYFDVRRWMIAEKPVGEGGQGGNFYGMNMDTNEKSKFFERHSYEKRDFRRAYYLYPIPLNQIQITKNLVQNPGYE